MSWIRPQKLTNSEIQILVENKMRWLLVHTQPLQMILFGSAARGELTDQSDLDFAFIFKSEAARDKGKQAIYRASREDFWPLDFLFYTLEEFNEAAVKGGVAFLIKNEGKIIYNTEASNDTCTTGTVVP